jgi:hypothetical protein
MSTTASAILCALVLSSAAAVGLAMASERGAPVAAAPRRPDITSKQGIKIGTVFIPWGGSAKLKANEAHIASPDSCSFNTTYDMVNVGSARTAPAFANRLVIAPANTVATNTGLALNAGQSKQITTFPYLTIGTHRLTLLLDNPSSVAESNEGNNSFSVTYTLNGPCKGSASGPGVAITK